MDHGAASETNFVRTRARPTHKNAASTDLASLRQRMLRHWLADWKDVAQGRSIGADIIAGITVAAVALPLNLALAVASGLPASAGLVAGAIGGVIAGLLGGAPLQVTGPAAALSTMVLAIATQFGAEGVAAACLMIGVVQIGLGFSGAGKLAENVPESVLAGFTTGVGLKLLDQQIPELLGFEQLGRDYKLIDMASMMHRPQWLHHVSWPAVMCGLLVAFMVTTLKPYKRFPAAVVGIAISTFLSVYLDWQVERVGTVPAHFPRPSLPTVPDERWLDLAVLVAPLALLASLESLLSARAIERMAKPARTHDPNLELLGQGAANFLVGWMAGLPVSGVIVRSGVNVQSGAKTRLAALLHGLLLGLSVLYLGRFIGRVPIAALAGLLCVVAMRLLEWQEFRHLLQTRKVEALAFALTAVGTVSGHLMIGLVAGVAVHSLDKFFRRHETRERSVATANRARGVRAVIDKGETAPRLTHAWKSLPESARWIDHIQGRGFRAKNSFVHEQASVIGNVVLGEHVHIAAGSSVRADEGTPFFIGANTNLQDGVIVHALKDRHVLVSGEPWAVYVGTDVSIAHNAMVHGPCFIGDHTFVGFKAVVHDSIVGANCFVGHGALVVGVEIPEGRLVPNGAIVDSADAVEKLPLATHTHHEFNEDVVEVNRGLAVAYQQSHARTQNGSAESSPSSNHLAPASTPSGHSVWDESWSEPANTKERF